MAALWGELGFNSQHSYTITHKSLKSWETVGRLWPTQALTPSVHAWYTYTWIKKEWDKKEWIRSKWIQEILNKLVKMRESCYSEHWSREHIWYLNPSELVDHFLCSWPYIYLFSFSSSHKKDNNLTEEWLSGSKTKQILSIT